MLDIFWRTFVEGEVSVEPMPAPSTRYQLLARYWRKKISNSTRYHNELLPQRLDEILEQAAKSLEPFSVADIDIRPCYGG